MNPSIRQVFACIMEANLPKISGTNRQLKNLPEIRKTLKLPATGSIQGSLNRLRACPKRRGCPSSSVLYRLSQTFFRCWGTNYPNIYPTFCFLP